MDTGKETVLSSAVRRIVEDDILKNWTWEPWMEFRLESLWTIDVCDVITANIEGIKKLMAFFGEGIKKWFSKKDALRLFTRESTMGLGDGETTYFYGMSKMTVADEVKDYKKYDNMTLAEFCEMIARVANYKFAAMTDLTLDKKVELVLDDIFQVIRYRRRERKAMVEEVSESDDDY